MTRPLSACAALVAAMMLAVEPTPAIAQQRVTGVIGQYVPPRDWPVRERSFDLLHQAIHIAFSMPRRELTASVTTRLVPFAPTDTVRLDAGNLTIDAATDARGRPLRFSYDTSHVTVRLGRRARAGDTVEFTLRYHTRPERGIYFVPRRNVIWSQGEAVETRNWIPTYDAPNDKQTWEFFVTADTGLKVLSNGHLLGVTAEAGGRQVWHWSQKRPASTYLMSVVVGPFTVLRDQWRGRPVDYWVAPDTALAGWRTFGETPTMIEFYSRILGVPFQWAKYDQSVIPDFTYGGMENVSATTQTDLALHSSAAEPQTNGRSLAAHELAHQWFGDLTTTAAWAHIWLNEGLTTYMESVEAEQTRGLPAAQREWADQQEAAEAADLNEKRALVWGQYQGDDPIALFFSGHVYPKGAQVAHQLRRLLGDSLFWAGMHRFLVDNAFKPVTTADFAVAFEKVAHRDLDWFFDQWCYGIGYPKVRVSRHWDAASKTLHVTVAETQPIDSIHPLFRFPVTIRITTADSLVRHDIMVSKPSETFAIPLPGDPLTFRFDEGGWLLGTVTTDQTSAELAEMAEHDLDFSARIWALDQLEQKTDSAAAAARRFIVLNEWDPRQRATALEQMEKDHSAPTLEVVRSALTDPDGAVRGQAVTTLAALDSAAARSVAEAMFRTDPSLAARVEALAVYARAAGAAAEPDLIAAATGPNALGLRITAVRHLAQLHDAAAADALARVTDPVETRALRGAALGALVRSDSSRAAQVAADRIADPDPLFAVQAVRVVGRVGGASGQALLRSQESRETRVTVLAAIRRALQAR